MKQKAVMKWRRDVKRKKEGDEREVRRWMRKKRGKYRRGDITKEEEQ